MAQRRRSKARPDTDLDQEGSTPRRRTLISEEEEEAGNEDLSLEIVARARRRAAVGDSPGFAELPLLSSSEEIDEDAVVELGEVELRKKEKKKRREERRKKKKHQKEVAAAEKEEPEVASTQEGQTGTAGLVLTEDGVDVPVPSNTVLRKLLRIPRYFDPGETILETCFNCGEEGHFSASCPMEKRKKPCFICGLFGHNVKQCTQGQECFICKKGGHMAKDCPDKNKRNTQQLTTLCLRCGETGHDLFGCGNDYPPDDVKEIKCYVCKQNGHLCCADFSDTCPKEVSCYNCAQPGHTGLGCAKQRKEISVVTTPTLCYRCGEEGHFARGCTNNAKSDRLKGDWASHSRKNDNWKKDFCPRSAPHDTRKRRIPLFDDRRDTPRGKSQVRGGWIPDGHDEPFKKYKPNGWASSCGPKKPYTNHHQHSSGYDYSSPQSSRWQNQGFSSPSSNYSPNSRNHSFSSSRFATNSHLRFEGN